MTHRPLPDLALPGDELVAERRSGGPDQRDVVRILGDHFVAQRTPQRSRKIINCHGDGFPSNALSMPPTFSPQMSPWPRLLAAVFFRLRPPPSFSRSRFGLLAAGYRQERAAGHRAIRARPMVPFGDPREVDPFTIDCGGKGRGRWADPNNWVYDFDRDLPPACAAASR
jgi:hypothetical protein